MKPPKLVLYGRSIVCRNGTSVIWENLVRALEIIIFKMGISHQFFILSHPSITVMHRDCRTVLELIYSLNVPIFKGRAEGNAI